MVSGGTKDDTLPCKRQALAWQKEPKAWTQAFQALKFFFHDFLFPSTEIIVMQCILSVESFSWGTNCHPSMIGNYRKSEIRGCVVSQSLKHSALFAHLMFVYTFHMLSHLSKVFTVNFIKHRTLWLILNRAGQFFHISK